MGMNYDGTRQKRQPPIAPLTVREVRDLLDMKQAEVCEQVSKATGKSFTKGALSAIELGYRGASAETLAALEVALRLPPGRLTVDYDPSHDRRSKKGADA